MLYGKANNHRFKYANPSSEKELKARLVWLREHIAQEQDLVEMHRLNQEIVTVLSQLEAAMSQDEHKNTKVFGTKRKFTPEPEISEVLTGGGLLMKAKAPQQSKTTLAGHCMYLQALVGNKADNPSCVGARTNNRCCCFRTPPSKDCTVEAKDKSQCQKELQ